MEFVKSQLRALKNWYKGLPEKKKYIEVLTAVISIPVLLSVLLNNLGSIQERKQKENLTPTPAQGEPVTVIPIEVTKEVVSSAPTQPAQATPTPQEDTTPTACKREVGPVEITSPKEGATIRDVPVCIDISYSAGEYCAVVWSYSINGSAPSNFTDKAICLHNLDPGEKELELVVKSIASGDEKVLQRTFTYAPDTSPTPSQTPTPIQEDE